jgi:hypothetical protein
MGKPDALPRWADHGSRKGDNDNLTLLAPELFWIHALAGARLQGKECKGNPNSIDEQLFSQYLVRGNPK